MIINTPMGCWRSTEELLRTAMPILVWGGEILPRSRKKELKAKWEPAMTTRWEGHSEPRCVQKPRGTDDTEEGARGREARH